MPGGRTSAVIPASWAATISECMSAGVEEVCSRSRMTVSTPWAPTSSTTLGDCSVIHIATGGGPPLRRAARKRLGFGQNGGGGTP
jgi:hypothetical protein